MDFIKWLDEPIDWFGSQLLRRYCISDFVKFGLLPFIQKNGYSLGISEEHLRNCVGTGLFENGSRSHIESEWNYIKNTNWTDDDLTHFLHIFDADKWDDFWSRWGDWSDVSDNIWRGEDRRLDIQNFIWNCVDLETSLQSLVLDELLEDIVEDDNTWFTQTAHKQTNDVYLQEAVEYNGWGGYRR